MSNLFVVLEFGGFLAAFAGPVEATPPLCTLYDSLLVSRATIRTERREVFDRPEG